MVGAHSPYLPALVLQLCAGAIRSKNTMNILLQTILDAAVSAIAFYLVG
jgi:Amt family ammonium transporter